MIPAKAPFPTMESKLFAMTVPAPPPKISCTSELSKKYEFETVQWLQVPNVNPSDHLCTSSAPAELRNDACNVDNKKVDIQEAWY
jgi:hypothetical protein